MFFITYNVEECMAVRQQLQAFTGQKSTLGIGSLLFLLIIGIGTIVLALIALAK